MKKLIYLTLITCVIFATSCAKRIEDVNTDYYGYWESIDGEGFKEFDINTGVSSYISYEGIKSVSATGTARVKKNESKLKIGFKGFKVNTPTYQDASGNFFMVVEGDTYSKY